MKTKKNLTANEQFILAIEFLSLANEYVIEKKELTSITLAEWLDELQDPDKEIPDSQWSIERKFRLYTKKLKASGISLNLKTKKVSKLENSDSFKILSLYYKDISVRITTKNSFAFILRYRENNFLVVLRELVFIRYAIRYSLPVEFEYHKMMSLKTQSRRVIPRYVHSKDEFLTLVATDNKDNLSKHFILVNIVSIQNDLFTSYKSQLVNPKSLPAFDRNKFEESPESSFRRPMITYTIEFSSFSFERFVKTNDVDYKILKQEGQSVLAEIKSNDEFFIRAVLFNFGKHIKLLKPKKELQAFKEKIGLIYEHYTSGK
jgi:hypothetical protein